MTVSLRRARPLLGTLVEICVEAPDEACARASVEAAFAETSAVHARMSFHEAGSDLSRLHAARIGTPVEVDARTLEVLRCALDLAARSQGCFDPTIAGRLVAREFLPPPSSPFVPDVGASWRDVELTGGGVRLHRPLWLDLGGIGKGYAVDRAVDVLLARGATQVLVNAGGDLRVAGPHEEIVHLRGADDAAIAGAVGLRDAALASSAGAAARRHRAGRWTGTHLDGRDGKPVGLFSSASVIAPSCMIADALTKVVFAAPFALARHVLASYGAQVATHDARRGRQLRGRAA